MTHYRLWNLAGGTPQADPTSWADAYTSSNLLPAMVDADTLWVASDHVETQAGGNYEFPWGLISVEEGGVVVSSRSRIDDSYESMEAGGGYFDVSAGSARMYNSCETHGLYIKSSGQPDVDVPSRSIAHHFDMVVEFTSIDDAFLTDVAGICRFYNLKLKFVGGSTDNYGPFTITGEGLLSIDGLVMVNAEYKDQLIGASNGGARFHLLNTDLTGVGSSGGGYELFGNSTVPPQITLRNVKMPSSWGVGDNVSNTPGRTLIYNSDWYNQNQPETQMILEANTMLHSWGGDVNIREVWRLDNAGWMQPGATNPCTWRLRDVDIERHTPRAPLHFPLTLFWNTSVIDAPLTVDLYYLLYHSSAIVPLDNSQIWMDVWYYNNAASLVQKRETTKVEIDAAPVAYPTHATAWFQKNDVPAPNQEYRIRHTTAENIARIGPVYIQFYAGEVGTDHTLYIDPVVEAA